MCIKRGATMKLCPKCQIEHAMPGVYCSRKCGNSRRVSKETREKTSATLKMMWDSLSDDEKVIKTDLLKSLAKPKKYTSEMILISDWDKLGVGSKRMRVILEQNGRCNKCGLTHWQGQRLTMEYEHKDGNNQNNTRENVECICPNCHSQTLTWRGRSNGFRQSKIENILSQLELSDYSI